MGYDGNTCNMHLNDLAAKVKQGVQAAGLVGKILRGARPGDLRVEGTDKIELALRAVDNDPLKKGAWTTGAIYDYTYTGAANALSSFAMQFGVLLARRFHPPRVRAAFV